MKIRFTTLGCKLNFAESSQLGKMLLEAGHERAKAGETADVCIINTCSVTDTADHKDRQAIHRVHRENPDATLIVTGCYAQLRPGEVAEIEGVDYVLGANDKMEALALVQNLEQQESPVTLVSDLGRMSRRETTPYHAAYSKDDRTRCFLKIQDGCDYFCTYCTIPNARGRSRNASIADTIAQVEQALRDGAREIVLTGVNIGDFGRSTGESFADLVRAIDSVEGEFRVRISSCEPNLLSDEIIDFVAGSRHFAPHFHIPLQSGSDTVLKIMHRRYDTALFRERIEHIKRVMPQAFIGVDCMVGVRGETEECFDEYVRFLESLPVSQLHVFTYSERANTRMVEDETLCVIPQKERNRRSQVLHRLSEQKLIAHYAEHKGEKAVVLWEGKREKDGTMSGWTENYIRVSHPYDKAKINTFEEVVL